MVIMSSDGRLGGVDIPAADLVLSRSVLTHEVGEEGIARFIGEKIRELWKK
ncbi:hypothetical protein D3C76_1828420 [compost metagenome]